MRARLILATLVLAALPLAAQRLSTQASQPPTTLPGVNNDPFVFPNQPPNQPTILFRPNFTVPSTFEQSMGFRGGVRIGGRGRISGGVRFGGFREHRRFRNQGAVLVPYAVPVYDTGTYEDQQVEETQPQSSGNEIERAMMLQYLANSNNESAKDSRYGNHYLDSRETAPTTAKEPTPAPEPPAPPNPDEMLMLVFRDGHQLLVANYAIVGDTFYDLTPGHARRVKLSDLDLVKTKKLNDDRGVDFNPPKTS